jgi:hypothetical protein
MNYGQYEVALHEAGHLVVHAKVGRGCANRVWIGQDSGRIDQSDWSLLEGRESGLVIMAAAGPAIELIRGRDLNRCSSDIAVLRCHLPHYSDERWMAVYERVQSFLERKWSTVEFTAGFLLQNANKQGNIGKRACRHLFREIRARMTS